MGLIHQVQAADVVTTTLDSVFNWARSKSLWWLGYGIACCAIEMMSTSMSRYDFDRFGIIPRSSPRQSDVMIVAGPVTKKMEPVIKRLYDQMAEPRWIIAMGSCAISGGAFAESYHVLKGVDTILPVDIYVPGCPPRPEALIYGFLELRKVVQQDTFVGGKVSKPASLFVPPVLTPEMEKEVEKALENELRTAKAAEAEVEEEKEEAGDGDA